MHATAAIVRAKSAPFEVQDVELDDPRPGEILVRIAGVGMCHTDLVVRDQYYPVPLPAVLGHEGAGVVEKVGTGVTKVVPGDHVVLTFASCGMCLNCAKGQPTYCLDFFSRNFGGLRPDGSCSHHIDGQAVHGNFFGQSSFASHALATERNVVVVPKDVPLEILGPLGCGVQTGAGSVLNALKPKAGSSIAIFGAGSVGISAVMAAAIVGCTKIIVVDINQSRLQLAAELGATHVINGQSADAVEAIRSITGGGVNYSLEATALPALLRQAVDCLAVTGVCGLIGAPPLGTEAILDMNSILFGRTVRGIIEGDSVPDELIPTLIDLYKQGRFPFDKLIKVYQLEEINEAAAASERGEVLKPVLVP